MKELISIMNIVKVPNLEIYIEDHSSYTDKEPFQLFKRKNWRDSWKHCGNYKTAQEAEEFGLSQAKSVRNKGIVCIDKKKKENIESDKNTFFKNVSKPEELPESTLVDKRAIRRAKWTKEEEILDVEPVDVKHTVNSKSYMLNL